MGDSEREEMEKGEKIFKEMMAENSEFIKEHYTLTKLNLFRFSTISLLYSAVLKYIIIPKYS